MSLSSTIKSIQDIMRKDAGVDVANDVAPEHLEVMTRDADDVAGRITSAGAVFIGPWTPEAVGDGCGAGTGCRSCRPDLLVLIHEALHRAGLDEWPHDRSAMTSLAINTMVGESCKF